MVMIEQCPVCGKDWRFPLNHRDCVEAIQARVRELEHEDQIKTDADAACAMAAEAEIDRLRTRLAALTAVLTVALREGFRGMKSVDDASSSLVLSVPGDYLAKIKAALDAGTGET
jgi:hypothetical protein